jgi:hypothetical protein
MTHQVCHQDSGHTRPPGLSLEGDRGMLDTAHFLYSVLLAPMQGQTIDWTHVLNLALDAGLETGTLLLVFTLAVFAVLVFAVRLLMVVTKKPVPVDPFDMAKPVGFRALMLGSAGLLTPLVALEFLPLEGIDLQVALMVAFVFEILVVGILWLTLYLFYRVRAGQARPRR